MYRELTIYIGEISGLLEYPFFTHGKSKTDGLLNFYPLKK
jgi:hypothetical protein